MTAVVVGGGLAGCEAAWALAARGVDVTLYEMRPTVRTPAHQTDRLAELVCSNSFKSLEPGNAHGLLKAELRRLGSLLLECADQARVPGGAALAVDREIFSKRWMSGSPRTRASGSCARKCARSRAIGGCHRAPDFRSPGRRPRPPARGRRARVLRRYRAGGIQRVARSRVSLRTLPLREGWWRRLPERSHGRRGVRRVHRCAPVRRRVHRPRVRSGPFLRRMPAGGGDGPARPGDAAIRADEAGRPSRSKVGTGAVRRGAAAA